jgi:uncharacterized protein YeaO (DUF488 family)
VAAHRNAKILNRAVCRLSSGETRSVSRVSRRYRAELDDPEHAEAPAHLRDLAKERPVTLLAATQKPEISEAEVLAELLRG